VTYEQHLAAVIADPDNDAPRRAFADFVRTCDAERARFIELQLASASERRERREPRRTVVGAEDQILLRRHDQQWTRTLYKYAARVEYDRGFVAKIVIDPELFLEYGEWLYMNAPIRHLGFVRSAEDPFPIDRLAASPLLERLDTLDFTHCGLDDADVARLAASPHLGRLLFLDLSWIRLAGAAYGALAASPTTRKMLVVVRSGHDIGAPLPCSRYETVGYDRDGAPMMDWTPMPPEGKALEARYGYVPWLHPRDNGCDAFDAAYYVGRGALPARP
jgi:uncharacterized protein (TIGR02996 family)